jgi:hypothetical protein
MGLPLMRFWLGEKRTEENARRRIASWLTIILAVTTLSYALSRSKVPTSNCGQLKYETRADARELRVTCVSSRGRSSTIEIHLLRSALTKKSTETRQGTSILPSEQNTPASGICGPQSSSLTWKRKSGSLTNLV